MGLERLCWLALVACVLHIIEEYLLDWRSWVRSVSGIDISNGLFLTMNALLVLLGVGFAGVANRLPTLGLAIPALMLINATFFHVGAFLWTRGRFSPGLITSITLFYPMGIWCFKSAYDAGILTASRLVGSFALGVVFMAMPLLMLRAGALVGRGGR
jgi:Protein of unknown function with HXXEE motif